MSDQGPSYPVYPGPDDGQGNGPTQQPPQQPPPQPSFPPANPYQGYGPTRDPQARPGAVTGAAVITWICAGMMLLMFLMMILGAGMMGGEAFDEAMRDELDGQELPFDLAEAKTIVAVIGVVGALWSLAACVLAALAFARKNWARILLTVSSGLTILLGLAGFAAIIPVVFAAAGVAVIALLFSSGANAWFRGGDATTGSSYPPQPPTSPW